MSESPEEKEALAKLDEATRDVGWREEDKASAEGAIPATGRWWWSRLLWPFGGGSMLFRKRPLEPGLRDALRKDDEKR